MGCGSPGGPGVDVGPIRAHLTAKCFFVAEDEGVGRKNNRKVPGDGLELDKFGSGVGN